MGGRSPYYLGQCKNLLLKKHLLHPHSRHHYILLAVSGKQGAQCLMVRLCLTPQAPCPNQREMLGNEKEEALCDDPAYNNNFIVKDTALACSSPSSILNFLPYPSKIREAFALAWRLIKPAQLPWHGVPLGSFTLLWMSWSSQDYTPVFNLPLSIYTPGPGCSKAG